MNSIVCATRAGEGSRAVQQAAIALAKETDQQLVFLYIVESRIYEALEEPMRSIVRAELYWLAKTLLRIAGNRAKESELQPSLIIREGNVQDEISAVVKSVNASCLMLGAPRHKKANTFGEDAIIDFAKSIQQATGVKVQIEWPKEVTAYDFSGRQWSNE